jgi:hypothetical protein
MNQAHGGPAWAGHGFSRPGPGAERGRGLAIVAALARSSGVRATQAGKTTWFTLALTDRAHQAARQIDHEPEAGA